MSERIATVEIAGREYLLNLTRHETDMSILFEITGKRRANGALVISKQRGYEGRAVVIGISALERLSWWDINCAVQHLIPEVSIALLRAHGH